ncbi:hypothetical protein JZ751_021540 [Albula glossodonta]|uniref:G-protein coupled receptors family 1 profile domain-containing protein n=1 Tax=Albula glossodonta TaxID=121402 RepID=A0A8T2NVL8_9TELE|nr:hypothetical protein JZ751_021540 [Albula glossodonta]
MWSQGQLAPSPLRCPLGPLPIIYYSALLCLGLPDDLCITVTQRSELDPASSGDPVLELQYQTDQVTQSCTRALPFVNRWCSASPASHTIAHSGTSGNNPPLLLERGLPVGDVFSGGRWQVASLCLSTDGADLQQAPLRFHIVVADKAVWPQKGVLVLRRQKSSYSYLLALAAADILVLLLIVFVDFLLEDFVLGAPLPPTLGKMVQVLEFCSLHTSVWITVPLTVDRYMAVCHPLRYHALSYPARARRVILAVYLGGLLSGAPYYWWPDLWWGVPKRAVSTGQQALVWVHCVTVYLVPCSVFCALNSAIVCRLRGRRSCFPLRACYSTGKTTAILLAITSMFAVLWAPRVVVILYRLYSTSPAPGPARLLHLLADIANMLALLNTSINFFLYCFISRRFRSMAAAVLAATFRCKRQPRPVFYARHSLSITSSPRISPSSSHCIKMLVYQYDTRGRPTCPCCRRDHPCSLPSPPPEGQGQLTSAEERVVELGCQDRVNG